MATYNWANLSDYDFEMICRDVMAVLVEGHVEAFARGRDGGVDLRHTHGRTYVLGQAKHFLRSSYASLLSAAQNEKKKVDGSPKKPNRYLLFTSQALTPKRKLELSRILRPYCKRSADIFGLEDIEGVLASHPDIEEHHYKLWLSSVRVFERIVGNASLTRSRIRVDELLDRAKLFVPHDAMPEAQRILREEKSLIISGLPGIGKTTMAEMLSLRFLAAGYRVHFVSSVGELEREARDQAKQLFLYDDFLGRTNLREAPPASDQERLFTFMRYARKTANKYVILTTREYLYHEARIANERLRENRADLLRCLLDVAGYSRLNRARILYNHLYWAPGIPEEALTRFVEDKAYRKVIDHEHFNPRFIADTIHRLAPATLAGEEDDDLWT